MADNLLDKASILLTPTAYNDGSMLSIKPENGDGDFDFSRGSAATRVNAQGLVENVQIISSELVSNGNFSQIGTEEVLNGNFSQEGSELVTNGDFATDSDWTKGNGWTINGGEANSDGTNNYDQLTQNNVLTIGKSYKLTFDLTYISGALRTHPSIDVEYNSSGNYTLYFVASATNLIFTTWGAFTGSIDNVSVKEVGQNWTLDTGWSIGENKIIADSASGDSYQNLNFAGTKTFKITFDCVVDSGQFAVRFNDKQWISTTGSYTIYETTSTSIIWLDGRASQPFTGSITNVSVKEVDPNGYWNLIGGASFSNGGVRLEHTPAAGQFLSTNILTVGKKYKLSYEITESNSGGIKEVSAFNQTMDSGLGVHTLEFEALSSQLYFSRTSAASNDVVIDNISVKEITDDTNIPRINYEGFSYQDSLGSELITNGNFSNGLTNWTNNSSWWSIVNGEAYHPASTSMKPLSQSVSTEVGKEYKISVNVNIVSGTPQVFWDKVSGQEAQSLSQGLNEVIVTTFKTNSAIYFGRVPSTNTEFYIDNVSVKEYLGQEVVPDSGCGAWLLEGQSTNLLTHSEDFSQWQLVNISTELSNTLSPDGSSFMTKATFSSAGLNSYVRQNRNMDSGSITVSIFVKKGLIDSYASIRIEGIDNNISVWFNLDNGTIGSETGSPTNKSIVSYGNGIYRISATTTSTTDLSFSTKIQSADTDGGIPTENATQFYWGGQAENLSYATSYIPTNGSIATRLADVATNSGNSSLINSTEGVLYAEIAALADDETHRYISLSDGTNNNRIIIRYVAGSSNLLGMFAKIGNVTQVSQSINTDITVNTKVALKYKLNDYALWVNGVEVKVETSALVPSEGTLNTLNFSAGTGLDSFFYGKVKALAVYKEALTDAELQSLTTQ